VDPILAALAEQQAELGALLRDRSEPEWHRRTPCETWDVADVVLHVAQSDEMAAASVRGRFAAAVEELAAGLVGPPGTVDDAAELMVVHQRGAPGAEVGARWAASAAALRDALATADLHARVEWVAGHLSARTLATTRLAECWIHAGDVATAFGVELPPTDRLRHVARLAWRTVPYAYQRAGRTLTGPVGFDLVGPAGEPWAFGLDADPATVIRGPGVELCLVAARRVAAADTALEGDGPDAAGVLELVRTYA
jgi:uncharacterized protein (TIGR03084 family)